MEAIERKDPLGINQIKKQVIRLEPRPRLLCSFHSAFRQGSSYQRIKIAGATLHINAVQQFLMSAASPSVSNLKRDVFWAMNWLATRSCNPTTLSGIFLGVANGLELIESHSCTLEKKCYAVTFFRCHLLSG